MYKFMYTCSYSSKLMNMQVAIYLLYSLIVTVQFYLGYRDSSPESDPSISVTFASIPMLLTQNDQES